MPWCESCEKNWTPTSLRTDGSCPTCGATVQRASGGDPPSRDHRAPWHFWVGVVAVIVYLGWRVIQGLLLLF